MDWQKVGKQLAEFAPLIGTALAGPAGGAVGTLVASTLGTDATPDAVYNTIRANPEALERIQALELNNAAEIQKLLIQAETTRLAEINRTMRAEYATEGWFKTGWRPVIGYTVALCFAAVVLAIVYAIVKDPSKASDLVNEASMIMTTMLVVLGVQVRERSKDKRTAMGDRGPTLLQQIFGNKTST